MAAGKPAPAALRPVFFETREDWRAWLAANHAREKEVIVGFYKRETGRPSITWPESVEEALCFGWIDGVRRSLGPESYCIRFTERRKGSNWSLVNLRAVEKLIASGQMQPSGIAKYNERDPKKCGQYSFEGAAPEFDAALLKQFKSDKPAWKFFQEQPPSYRKRATGWVVSAKQPETRLKRLSVLMQHSKLGKRM